MESQQAVSVATPQPPNGSGANSTNSNQPPSSQAQCPPQGYPPVQGSVAGAQPYSTQEHSPMPQSPNMPPPNAVQNPGQQGAIPHQGYGAYYNNYQYDMYQRTNQGTQGQYPGAPPGPHPPPGASPAPPPHQAPYSRGQSSQWGSQYHPQSGQIPTNGAYQQGYPPQPPTSQYNSYYNSHAQSYGPPPPHPPTHYQQSYPGAAGYGAPPPGGQYPVTSQAPTSTASSPATQTQQTASHKSPLQSLQKMLPGSGAPQGHSAPGSQWPPPNPSPAPPGAPPPHGYQGYPGRGQYYGQYEGYPPVHSAYTHPHQQLPPHSQPPVTSTAQTLPSPQNGAAYPTTSTPSSLPPPPSPASSCGSQPANPAAPSTPTPNQSSTQPPASPAPPGPPFNGNASGTGKRRSSVDSETGSYYSTGSATPQPTSQPISASSAPPPQQLNSSSQNSKTSTNNGKAQQESVPNNCENANYNSNQSGSRPPSTTGSIGPSQSDISSLSASPGSSAAEHSQQSQGSKPPPASSPAATQGSVPNMPHPAPTPSPSVSNPGMTPPPTPHSIPPHSTTPSPHPHQMHGHIPPHAIQHGHPPPPHAGHHTPHGHHTGGHAPMHFPPHQQLSQGPPMSHPGQTLPHHQAPPPHAPHHMAPTSSYPPYPPPTADNATPDFGVDSPKKRGRPYGSKNRKSRGGSSVAGYDGTGPPSGPVTPTGSGRGRKSQNQQLQQQQQQQQMGQFAGFGQQYPSGHPGMPPHGYPPHGAAMPPQGGHMGQHMPPMGAHMRGQETPMEHGSRPPVLPHAPPHSYPPHGPSQMKASHPVTGYPPQGGIMHTSAPPPPPGSHTQYNHAGPPQPLPPRPLPHSHHPHGPHHQPPTHLPPDSKHSLPPHGVGHVPHTMHANGNISGDIKPLETCPVPAVSQAPPPPEGVKITKVLNNHVLPLPLAQIPGSSKKSGPFSGPFIRLKGSLTRPSDVRVMNNVGSNDENVTSKANKLQTKASSSASGREHAKKAGTAVHLSTLSPGYDTVTRDPSWICALCLSPSHEHGLGDLYGPYLWSDKTPPPSFILAAMRKLAMKVNAQKPQLVDASDEEETHTTSAKRKKASGAASKRKKSTSSQQSQLEAAQEVPLTQEQEEKLMKVLQTEYWVHEDCVIYTQGVFLSANGTLMGLEEAIRESASTWCNSCHQAGATVACVARHCNQVFHYHCAVANHAKINQENFSILCSKHVNAK